MVPGDTQPIAMPVELLKELEPRAKKAGMTVAEFVTLLARLGTRQHDEQFAAAARRAFTKYPHALRTLAQ